ncbi:MAG: peptide ABC transporter ATP-binding protein [Confluentimicrobium sp.]|uniref:ABC transporter ATP-binding protein n=1 Tax=Actibacterium sp. TaxID=1872125 RepID=UPI000C5909EC|nr:ABC transporter ATP-binding protein [Actibacterium sp.]MBC58915.1 peptide ABC transporter ATP-binding protein [Actibacterium sp.]|tara:strand:- start:8203 stop:9201 length:999 start_codon:yes stop_codon:yes gene_type:complete
MTQPNTLLKVEDLGVAYYVDKKPIPAIRQAFVDVNYGEGVGIVGESGSGKSTFVRALTGLLPATNAEVTSGHITFEGKRHDLRQTDELRPLRGAGMAMIFQDPLSYLNPLMTIGRQISEAIRLNHPDEPVDSRVRELLDLVRLPMRCIKAHPHELSGGMRQRVLMAIALGCRPKLLIADEPTTALDVTTQAEILDLLKDVRKELGMSLLLISHDMGVVSQLCDRVFVMYGGYTIESGRREDVLFDAAHPYTQGLVRAAHSVRGSDGRFVTLRGDTVVDESTAGCCPFAARCTLTAMAYRDGVPGMVPANAGGMHEVRCLFNKTEIEARRAAG